MPLNEFFRLFRHHMKARRDRHSVVDRAQGKNWQAKSKSLGAHRDRSHMTCLHTICHGWCQGLAHDAAVEIKHWCCFPYPHVQCSPNQEHTSRAWNRTILKHHNNVVKILLNGNNYWVVPQFGLGWRNIYDIVEQRAIRTLLVLMYCDGLLTRCWNTSHRSFTERIMSGLWGELHWNSSNSHKTCKCLQKCLHLNDMPQWTLGSSEKLHSTGISLNITSGHELMDCCPGSQNSIWEWSWFVSLSPKAAPQQVWAESDMFSYDMYEIIALSDMIG